ncbi:MAG: peptidoglycan-binding protein [Rhodospirillales bacterium]|nr:peptidoglycan-binding protein [Rhodospirillales bacterium]MBO6788368.1 peptidoglycan-binding protein [Rhodospirillales bacterium]
MLSALRNESKGRFKFIALGSLGNVIAAIQAQNLPADEQAARIRALRANAQADILVHGTVRTDGGVETLSYDAVSIESGELLASTGAVALGPQIPPLFADNGRGVLPPAQVVSKSVTGRYRPTVEEAERLLAEKGYDPGPVDGVMSPETRQALSDYQRNSALPVNGRMTRQTVENLRRDTRVVFY